MFLVLCFLVPHRVCEKKFVVVSLFKGYIAFNKNRLEFEKKYILGVFLLRGVLPMAGCETLTVKLSARREVARGQDR